jgi:hypothetical protein
MRKNMKIDKDPEDDDDNQMSGSDLNSSVCPGIDLSGIQQRAIHKTFHDGFVLDQSYGTHSSMQNGRGSYRQPGLLCTPRNFIQSSKFLEKKKVFVN